MLLSATFRLHGTYVVGTDFSELSILGQQGCMLCFDDMIESRIVV